MVNAELHHRLKNVLSVVSALARQSGADRKFSDVFDKRLRGIAATLDLLTEKQWQGVRIRDLSKPNSAFLMTISRWKSPDLS